MLIKGVYKWVQFKKLGEKKKIHDKQKSLNRKCKTGSTHSKLVLLKD